MMSIIPKRGERISPDKLNRLDAIGACWRQRKNIIGVGGAPHVLVTAPTFHARTCFAQVVKRIAARLLIRPGDYKFTLGLIQRDALRSRVRNLAHAPTFFRIFRDSIDYL